MNSKKNEKFFSDIGTERESALETAYENRRQDRSELFSGGGGTA